MILHLVRHGQSTWNLERRLQGQRMEVPLTDLGLAQAKEAARALVGREVTALWSSDQVRARQTAAVIGEALSLPVAETPALREQSLGRLEGLRYGELTEEPVPDGLDISEVRWGGGESVADVHRRLARFLTGLPEADGETVLVSHGDTLRILLAVLAGRGHREVEWEEFGNGEVRTVAWDVPSSGVLPAAAGGDTPTIGHSMQVACPE